METTAWLPPAEPPTMRELAAIAGLASASEASSVAGMMWVNCVMGVVDRPVGRQVLQRGVDLLLAHPFQAGGETLYLLAVKPL
jgi:hypothetical protein